MTSSRRNSDLRSSRTCALPRWPKFRAEILHLPREIYLCQITLRQIVEVEKTRIRVLAQDDRSGHNTVRNRRSSPFRRRLSKNYPEICREQREPKIRPKKSAFELTPESASHHDKIHEIRRESPRECFAPSLMQSGFASEILSRYPSVSKLPESSSDL